MLFLSYCLFSFIKTQRNPCAGTLQCIFEIVRVLLFSFLLAKCFWQRKIPELYIEKARAFYIFPFRVFFVIGPRLINYR
jgi:hypothetical protein